MPALSVESVSKRYGTDTALDAVSVTFPENLVTAVIGPSGCGKSTLLKLCNGLVRPDRGTVRVFGRPLDYRHLAATRRRLGYAVQGNGLFPHLSAGDNITLLARLAGWDEADIAARVQELLQLSHLQPAQLAQYPHELSGGQQQRVGLCRAMMLRPEVLLLDEPFAAIDPITRADIHQQMLQLHAAEPVTTVLVTHDMREALLLADHLVIMGDGRVAGSHDKAALLARHGDAEPEALLHTLLQEASP
ncbi:MAG: ABC transporter ATP-binding protein [Halioglobus sp.]|nr:ABC transporter ATP-binding protein [Halioglobus sp.]